MGLVTTHVAESSGSKIGGGKKIRELRIGSAKVKLAQNCNTPPWIVSHYEEWTCRPLSPPFHPCSLIFCTKEIYKLSSNLFRFSCDERLNDAWNITKGVFCKSKYY